MTVLKILVHVWKVEIGRTCNLCMTSFSRDEMGIEFDIFLP